MDCFWLAIPSLVTLQCATSNLAHCSCSFQAPAIGGEEQGGARIYAPSKQQSVHNMPAHTKLKFRCAWQNSSCSGVLPSKLTLHWVCAGPFFSQVLQFVDLQHFQLDLTSESIAASGFCAGFCGVCRQEGQAAPSELKKKDLRAQIEERERMHFAKARGVNFEGRRRMAPRFMAEVTMAVQLRPCLNCFACLVLTNIVS